MGKTLFYRCEGCGNFVMFLGKKTACTPKCCGEPMKLLTPNTSDASKEKHVPSVLVEGSRVLARIGSADHPMLDAHHIQFIALETEKGMQIRYLNPEEEPKAEFTVQEGDSPVSVYDYCNLHGLWEKDLTAPVKAPSSILVSYFSTDGSTKAVAETICEAVGGDLFEIAPKVPYTDQDLDWTDRSARCNEEMHDGTARPEMKESLPDESKYDVIFVGFPIWWGLAPKIVYTFLDSIDLAGRTIVPFCTSGGSRASMTDKDFEKNVKGAAKILPASLLNGKPSEDDIRTWLKSLDL